MSPACPARPAPLSTLAVNFYGLRALSEAMAPKIREGGAIVNVASIAGFGWRANLNRAASMVGVEGFPDVAKVIADHDVKNEEGYPVSKELLLLWTFRAAHQALFKDRGIRVNAVSPGPVETPILTQFREVLGDARVDSDIGARRPCRNPLETLRWSCHSCSGIVLAGRTAPTSRVRWRARRSRSMHRSRILHPAAQVAKG